MVPGLAVGPARRDLAAAVDGQRRRRGGRELAAGADRLAARARPGIAVAASRAVRSPGRVGLRRPRPSLACLPGRRRGRQGGTDPQPGPHARPRGLRPPPGALRRRPARVRRGREPHAAPHRRDHRGQGRHGRGHHRRRRAGADGPRGRAFHLPGPGSQGLLPDAPRAGDLRRRGTRSGCARSAPRASSRRRNSSTATTCSASPSGTCSWTTCANASPPWTTPA